MPLHFCAVCNVYTGSFVASAQSWSFSSDTFVHKEHCDAKKCLCDDLWLLDLCMVGKSQFLDLNTLGYSVTAGHNIG